MLQSPCPRCGEPSGDGLCGRCTAYVLRFDPFAVRPGLPGPPVDREVRRGSALLSLDPEAPLVILPARPRRADEGHALQVLRHLGLPDGGSAVLTRGDRDALHRMLRTWARSPPRTRDARQASEALYAEVAALPDLPPPIAGAFRALAGPPEETSEAEPPPPETLEVPLPPPEPEALPVPTTPAKPPPPPPPPDDLQEQRHALESLREELAAKKEELAGLVEAREREMDQKAGAVESQLAELRQREASIAEKESAIADAESHLMAREAEVQRRAAEARAGEAKRSLFFLLFSLEGVGRDTAKALSEVFGSEDRIRAAALEAIAAVPGVPPEQAVLVRDAFAGATPPPRRDLREKAEELLEEGRHEEALEVFEALVRLNPEDRDVWVNRGELLTLLGRREEAIASYERALALDPGHRAARGELTNLFFETGDFGLAAVSLEDLLKKCPNEANLWLARAQHLLDDGNATEATLIYNAVLEADPTNLVASLSLADLLLAMGDVNTAEREYTRALQHHPDSPEALLKKGLLLDRQGRWGAAVQLFNRAVSIRWDYQDAWAAKGQVLLAQGKPKDALECFDRLVAFDESRGDAWLGKAESHFALGENDRAAEAAGHALAIDAGDQDVKALLERLREATEHPKESVDLAELPPAQTFDAGVLTEAADALLEAGDAEGALQRYSELLSKSPKDARAWFGKGRALHLLERYGEAVRCFTAATENDPANEEYRRWLLVCEDRWKKEEA